MPFLRSFSIRFLGLVISIAPWAMFLALPVFDFGVFRQVETVSVGIHALATLSSLGLILTFAGRPGAVAGSMSWVPVSFGAVGIVTLVLAPLAINPAMAVHGTLELGVGAVWHIETAVIALAACVVWATGGRWRVIAAVSPAIAMTIAIVLQVAKIDAGENLFVVYDFEEWVGMASLIASIPLLALGRRSMTISAVALSFAGLAVSGNRAAVIAFAAVVAVYIFFRVSGKIRPRLQGTVGIAVAVFMAAGLAGAPPLLEQLAVATNEPYPSTLSLNPIDHVAVQDQVYGTVWQRGINVRYLLADLFSKPTRILTGTGFGSFERAIAEQGLWVEGRIFPDATETASLTYWDGRVKSRLHTHNLLVEVFSAGGILGAATWLTFVFSICAGITRNRLAAASMLVGIIVVGGSFWFLPNSMAPLLAMGIASVFSPNTVRDRSFKTEARERIGSLGIVLLAFVFALLTSMQATAVQGERLQRAFVPLQEVPCVGYETVGFPNVQINRTLYKILINKIRVAPEMERIGLAMKYANNLNNYSCLLRQASDRGDLLALRESLELRNRIIMTFPKTDLGASVMSVDVDYWDEDLEKLLLVSPDSEYLVIPFMHWLGQKSDMENRARENVFLTRLQEILPDNSAIARYGLARLKSIQGDKAGTFENGKAALELGLANYFEITLEQAADMAGQSE